MIHDFSFRYESTGAEVSSGVLVPFALNEQNEGGECVVWRENE